MSSELMTLHIGDRILEVNGEPVAEQPLEQVENLLRFSNTVLQVNNFLVLKSRLQLLKWVS